MAAAAVCVRKTAVWAKVSCSACRSGRKVRQQVITEAKQKPFASGALLRWLSIGKGNGILAHDKSPYVQSARCNSPLAQSGEWRGGLNEVAGASCPSLKELFFRWPRQAARNLRGDCR